MIIIVESSAKVLPETFFILTLNDPATTVWMSTSAPMLALAMITEVASTLLDVIVTSACTASSARVPASVNVWLIE